MDNNLRKQLVADLIKGEDQASDALIAKGTALRLNLTRSEVTIILEILYNAKETGGYGPELDWVIERLSRRFLQSQS